MDHPQPLNSPPMSKAEQRAAAREEQLTMMAMQQMQLQRTIWLMAKAAGGTVTVDESEMNPLWEVKYDRPKDAPTRLTVIAGAMPEATDEQIATMATKLVGTAKDPRDEAINVGLVDYPLNYIVGRLSTHVVWDGKKWTSRAEFDALKPETKG